MTLAVRLGPKHVLLNAQSGILPAQCLRVRIMHDTALPPYLPSLHGAPRSMLPIKQPLDRIQAKPKWPTANRSTRAGMRPNRRPQPAHVRV
jgi:hypothetical protein